MKTTKIVASAIALTTLGLTAAPAVHAADNTQTYKETGKVGFVAGSTSPTNPTDPIDPTNPITPDPDPDPIKPGTDGPLSIDYISNLDFGADHKISGSTETYYAQPISATDSKGNKVKRANYLQVTDNRGTNGGWKLSVNQDAQFNDGTSELAGAQLKMTGQTFNSSNIGDKTTIPTALNSGVITPTVGTDVEVVKAATGQGMGTWTDSFGTYVDGLDTDASMKAISLEVPGKTAKSIGTSYKTNLTWTLTDAGL